MLQIRDYICREGVVSTQQLTREFHLELTALQPMLDLWVSKGTIRKCQEKANCQSTCFKCRIQPPEYYQYLAPSRISVIE
nr:FeoC-like transcriptional regulator [Legionella maioricensis]